MSKEELPNTRKLSKKKEKRLRKLKEAKLIMTPKTFKPNNKLEIFWES